MDTVLGYFHALAAAVLVGKVVLLFFVVAPVLASQLQQDSFASVVRRLFPAYYALGMGAALLGVLCVVMLGMIHEPNTARHVAAGFWLLILAAEAYCRAPLTPQSNAMRDRLADQARRWEPAARTADAARGPARRRTRSWSRRRAQPRSQARRYPG